MAVGVRRQGWPGSRSRVHAHMTGSAPPALQRMIEAGWTSRGIVLLRMLLADQPSDASRTSVSPSSTDRSPAPSFSAKSSTTPANASAVPPSFLTGKLSSRTRKGGGQEEGPGAGEEAPFPAPAVPERDPRPA